VTGADRSGNGGSIYDLGYRGYEGPRLGRRAAVGALLAHSVRMAYGIGRGTRAKVVPFILAGIVMLPAVMALGIVALVSQLGPGAERVESLSPIRYSSYFPIIATIVMLFCAAQAPELFGRDQRFGTLPLYFSRALRRLDYASARMLGLELSLMLLVLVPQLALFIGRVLAASDPLAGFGLEAPSLPAVLVQSLLIAGVFGSAAAAVAAFTPRRAYATAAIITLFIVPSVMAQLISQLDQEELTRIAALLSPADVLDGTNAFLFDARADSPAARRARLDGLAFVGVAIAWIVIATGVTVRRYQRIRV
jgi:ABC-2 type transport system permease protein